MIVTVMRVKNDEKYVEHGLESLRPLGGPVIFLDDGSTDRTPDIAQSFDFVEYMRQDEKTMDEGRDRTKIYREALKLRPDWIFTLDGDEVLDPNTPGRLIRASESCAPEVNVFEMYLAVMASAPGDAKQKWYGPPEPYGSWSMWRMFRVRDADKKHRFVSDFGNNLHCGCVPKMKDRCLENLNAWIKYYGYETPDAVKRKGAFYSVHDPVNFPNTEKMWKEREKYRPVSWNDGADCREMGKHGTVIY